MKQECSFLIKYLIHLTTGASYEKNKLHIDFISRSIYNRQL